MAIALNSIRSPAGGTGASSVLPLASEPADTTKALVNKPAIAPAGTPVAPTAPLPLASAPSVPSTPPGGATAGQGINESAPKAAPAGDATAGQGGERSAPAGPAVPTPYQTNDPLAFTPPMTDTGYTQAPTPPVTETAQDLTPSILPASLGPSAPPATGDPSVLGELANTFGYTPTAGGTTQAPGGLSQIPGGIINDPFGGNTDGGGQGVPSLGTPTGSAPTTASNGTVSLMPTTPGNSLSNYTIGVGPTANRFGIAQDLIDQWDATNQPEEQRQLQTLSQQAAGRGQTGSGMARGSFADLGRTYNQQRTTAQRGFLDDALKNSIEDAYRNVGIAQQQQGNQQGQQQQGFTNQVTLQQLQDSEQGQQWQQVMAAAGFNADQMQRAFENAYKAQQLSDDETGDAFSRSIQEAIFGSQGSPEDILARLAAINALPPGYTGTSA